MKHTIQPLEKDDRGTIRFKPNKIVQYLLDNGGLNMNDLAVNCHSYSDDEWQQFAQLIGYSLSGYSELSYVDDYAYNVAFNSVDSELSEDKIRIKYLEDRLEYFRDALREPMAFLFECHPDDLVGK